MRNAMYVFLILLVTLAHAFAQAPGALVAPTTGSALVGALSPDGTAQGTLIATADGVAFHTYWVDVPAGVARWTLTLDADADLDLALKFGSEIGSYDDRDRGGDWDFRDWDTVNPTVLVVDAPQAGRWYVDVFNALQVGTRGSYRLISTAGIPGGVVTRPMPSPPVGGGTSGFAGRYRLIGGDVVLDLQQDAAGKLAGTLSGSGVTMTVEGATDAEGTYGIIYDDEGGMYFMAELVASGLRLTLYDADDTGDPVESSARALEFERDGGTPANPLAPPDGALPSPPKRDAAPPESGAVVDLRAGVQLGAGDRVRNAYVGASLVVPPGWQAWVADEPLLPVYLASQTQPGMAVVLTTQGVSLTQFERVLAEPIDLEDGASLRPVAPPQVQGDQVDVRYAAAGGVGVGRARTVGGPGVIMLYIGGAGQEAVGASLLEALAASARFEPAAATADLQRALQDWSGYRMWTYHYGSGGGAGDSGLGGRWSGEFEAHWDLCADGRFLHDGRSEQGTFSATGTAGGLASGTQFFGGVDTDAWSGRGRWTFAGMGDRVVLLLFDDAGSWSYYELGRARDGSVTLDGMPIERRAAGGC